MNNTPIGYIGRETFMLSFVFICYATFETITARKQYYLKNEKRNLRQNTGIPPHTKNYIFNVIHPFYNGPFLYAISPLNFVALLLPVNEQTKHGSGKVRTSTIITDFI